MTPSLIPISFTGSRSYAAQAAAFLQVRFLNSATRMHPDMNHAQLVKEANTSIDNLLYGGDQ
jgi:hypothetical protein